jgi:hypothetical protein
MWHRMRVSPSAPTSEPRCEGRRLICCGTPGGINCSGESRHCMPQRVHSQVGAGELAS